jgi:hypothetical protein
MLYIMGGYTCFSRYFYNYRGCNRLGGLSMDFVSVTEGATSEEDWIVVTEGVVLIVRDGGF